MLVVVVPLNGVASGPAAGIKFGIAHSDADDRSDYVVPEGPEIRRAADRIERALKGSKIFDATMTLPSLRNARSQIIGARVTAVDTRGKAMLTRFNNGLTLYSHNQLYGRWFVTRRGSTPKTRRSLRVALHTDTHSAWLYSATDIELLDAQGVSRHPFLSKLGPDILDQRLRPKIVCERLEETHFRRRALASLYLDQSFLAGNGNYLRSEILFSAGLHRSLRPKDLDRASRMRLARITLTLAQRAYELGGVTVTRKLAESLKNSGQRYANYRHWVFARSGKPCRTCGTLIEQHRLGGRSVFACPVCQPARP